jgi:hypothetical protein
MWVGNGRAAVVTRLSDLDKCLKEEEKRMDAITKRQDGITRMFWAIILGIMMILAGVTVDIVRARDDTRPQHSEMQASSKSTTATS